MNDLELNIVCPICKHELDVNTFVETDTLYKYTAYCKNCNCAFAVETEKTKIPMKG